MSFICGSLHNQVEEEDDFEVLWGAAATPTSSPSRCSRKVAKKMNSFCSKNKDSKNPYAGRGLDKFSALLADLDHKRQKIFTQKGSEDISFVRFAYSNSNECKPIVVKVKESRKLLLHDTNIVKPVVENSKVKPMAIATRLESSPPSNKSIISNEVQPAETVQKSNNKWELMKLETWRRPSYYLPLFSILILFFLVFFGRSFAVLCTSIGWYVVPSLNELRDSPKSKQTSNSMGPKRMKKEYARKMSEKVSSPKSVLNGLMNEEDQGQGRRRSF